MRKNIYKKRCFVLPVVLTLILGIVSCTQEEDIPLPNKGKQFLEFNVDIGDFKESISRSSNATAQESVIKSISLYLFYPDGRELIQENRHHTMENGKITVALPEDVMKDGLGAYLLANEDIPSSDTPLTEDMLLQYKTNRPPEEFVEKGFPMCTDRISVQTDAAHLAVTAVLRRVPSTLYVQVEETDENVYNNSFRIEVEGLQVNEGAMFHDMVASAPAQGKIDYSSKLSAVNAAENIAYFYQSGEVTICITPKDPNLGKAKTITIDSSKAGERNKKYVVQIRLVKSATQVVGFSVEVAEWDTEVIIAEILPPTEAPLEEGVLFAEGVTLASGWWDQNKSFGAEGFSMDSNLCWAAVCTNMIQWWLDRYVADGRRIPENAPNGFLSGRENAGYRQLAIFEEFRDPDIRGLALPAIPDYFTTYFPDIFPSKAPFYDGTIVQDVFTYTLKEFSDYVINAFKRRGVIYMADINHARTLWGCKYNTETGIVEKIYYTDSDDKQVVLQRDVPVKVSVNGKPMIEGMEIIFLTILYYTSG